MGRLASRGTTRQGGEAKGAVPVVHNKKEKPSQTQRLMEIAEAGELWRTPDQIPFASIQIGNHIENMPIGSTGFKRWLANRYYEEHGATVGD